MAPEEGRKLKCSLHSVAAQALTSAISAKPESSTGGGHRNSHFTRTHTRCRVQNPGLFLVSPPVCSPTHLTLERSALVCRTPLLRVRTAASVSFHAKEGLV